MSTTKYQVKTVTTKTEIVGGVSKQKTEISTSQVVTTKTVKKAAKQSYEDLVNNLKKSKTLYEDPDFPADTSSVFISKASKNYREFEWKRPKDICPNPKFFSGGASRFDVKQGALGDCWFLAVVASLSMQEVLFKHVVPDDQEFDSSNYVGAFRFRFWKFGKWEEVIVDDRIPTTRGKLVFMHSADSDEFWSALLEKAYAKMCGTYESLNGGSQSEAMEDFTGGLCETIKLNEKERPIDLFKQLKKYNSQSSLMGCAIESTKIEGVLKNGLITGHAYSITGISEVKTNTGTNVELVRVRNPWGNEKEWNGRWSDKSSEWDTISKIDKQKLVSSFEADGEFWMCYDDFVNNFTKIEVCHLGPESLDENIGKKRRWESSIEEGSWLKNVNAGGCRNFLDSFVTNPQFQVEVVDPDPDDDENLGTIIIGLMQKDMRTKNKEFYVIGYVIYKLKDSNAGLLNKSFFKFTTSVAKSPGFVNMREICGRHKLAPGHYVIIPSTFNPNEEADFILRIYSQKPNKTEELDVDNGRVGIAKHLHHILPSKDVKSDNAKIVELERQLEDLFKKVCGPGEVINACQLRDILNEGLKKDPQCSKMNSFDGFDLEICRSMIALFDDNHTGKLEFVEFNELFKHLRIWKAAFREFDADDNGVFDACEFRNALNNIGLSVCNNLFKAVANRFAHPDNGVIGFQDFIMAAIRLSNAFDTMAIQGEDKKSGDEIIFEPDEFLECFLYM